MTTNQQPAPEENVLRTEIKAPTLPNVSAITLLMYAAFAGLYVSTFYKLFTYGWKNADYSHGPLILGAFLWLLWKQRRFLQVQPDTSCRIWPPLLLISGLVLYTAGSIFSSMVTES